MPNESPATRRFGEAFRTLRQTRGFNQLELAHRTGLQPSAISHFETGRRSPSMENLIRLADALGVSVDRLVGRGEEPESGVYPPNRLTAEVVRNCSLLSEYDLRLLADLARSLAEKRSSADPATAADVR